MHVFRFLRWPAVAAADGEGGSDLPQSTTYFAHAAASGGSPVYLTASDTVYANNEATGGRTTKHAYAFAAASNRLVAATTIVPVVATGQNGSGIAAETTSVLDAFGRTTWSKDALGHVSYVAYDAGTGGAVTTIADVDYAKLSGGEQASFDATGWDQPAGLHQVSTAQVDDLGRAVKSTDPDGLVTYTVYKDAARETRVYAAGDAAAHAPLLPVRMMREDLANKYTQSLTMSAGPVIDGSNLPTGAEAISSVQSLSRSYVNDSGQAVGSRMYTSLPSGGYSATASLGAEGTNYLGTSSTYDYRDGGVDAVQPKRGGRARPTTLPRDREAELVARLDAGPMAADGGDVPAAAAVQPGVEPGREPVALPAGPQPEQPGVRGLRPPARRRDRGVAETDAGSAQVRLSLSVP